MAVVSEQDCTVASKEEQRLALKAFPYIWATYFHFTPNYPQQKFKHCSVYRLATGQSRIMSPLALIGNLKQ